MKKVNGLAITGAIALLFASGCAQQPTQEIEATKAAISTAAAEGAEKYANEDLKLLNDDLNSAMEEVKAQDEKTFKNYDKAKELLAKVNERASALKAEIPAKKEQAKNSAVAALDEAKVAVEEAKGLLAKAPKGKGSAADIEAMKGDLAGLEQAVAEAQTLIDGEDFAAAAAKSAPVKEKAAEISAQVTEALAKTGKKK